MAYPPKFKVYKLKTELTLTKVINHCFLFSNLELWLSKTPNDENTTEKNIDEHRTILSKLKRLSPIFSKNNAQLNILENETTKSNKISDEGRMSNFQEKKKFLFKFFFKVEEIRSSFELENIKSKSTNDAISDTEEDTETDIETESEKTMASQSKSRSDRSNKSKLVNTHNNSTNVKEMPINPFDFIWDTNNLMPKKEADKAIVYDEADLRLTRNKSNLGGRIAPSDRLQSLSSLNGLNKKLTDESNATNKKQTKKKRSKEEKRRPRAKKCSIGPLATTQIKTTRF